MIRAIRGAQLRLVLWLHLMLMSIGTISGRLWRAFSSLIEEQLESFRIAPAYRGDDPVDREAQSPSGAPNAPKTNHGSPTPSRERTPSPSVAEDIE